MPRFSIGRVHGTPKFVILETRKGPLKIHRRANWEIYITAAQLQLIIPGMAVSDPNDIITVPAQDYMHHFLFEVPKEIPGPTYMCSCGSPAGFYGSESYKQGASPVGLKLQCNAVIQQGDHAKGVI